MGLQRPVGLDRPVVAARHPCDLGLAKAVIRPVIAMHAMIDHLLQRFVDGWRGAEVHVRYPERDTCIGRNAIILRERFPLGEMLVAVVENLVEIDHDGKCPRPVATGCSGAKK